MNIHIVASGYDISCECGYRFPIDQVTDIPHNENGEWILTCPDCGTIHSFDGDEVHHAY